MIINTTTMNKTIDLRTFSHQGKAGAKAKNSKEQAKKIIEQTTHINENFRFCFRFRLV